MEVAAIHDERGYKKIRKQLAAMYDPSLGVPRIEIADADLRGSRKLLVHHSVRNGRVLDALEGRRVLRHVHALWGYPVVLHEIADDIPVTSSPSTRSKAEAARPASAFSDRTGPALSPARPPIPAYCRWVAGRGRGLARFRASGRCATTLPPIRQARPCPPQFGFGAARR